VRERSRLAKKTADKYYTEKLGGQNHAKKHYEKSFEDNKQEGFWRINNPSAWVAWGGILLLLSGLGWAIWKRKLLAKWWNSPAELEEEDDEEDDD